MSNVKFLNNDEGVSPIIATLVLIVVAIVGAAAVGLIMGSFSSSVSNQANAGQSGQQSSTTLQVAGSSSMQPVILTLATQFNNDPANKGLRVNVQAGGSGFGYLAVQKSIADIGMISEAPVASWKTAMPNMQYFQVGSSGVVFVTNAAGHTAGVTTVTKADLQTAYSAGSSGKFADVYDRSDASGTQDTAMAYLGVTPATSVIGASGNGGVRDAVIADTSAALGILDSDYVFGTGAKAGCYALNIDSYMTTSANILDEITTPAGKTYDPALIRPLNFITNGPATPTDLLFIHYVQNPSNAATFKAAGQIHVSAINSQFMEA